jgi:hypothetical protein
MGQKIPFGKMTPEKWDKRSHFDGTNDPIRMGQKIPFLVSKRTQFDGEVALFGFLVRSVRVFEGGGLSNKAFDSRSGFQYFRVGFHQLPNPLHSVKDRSVIFSTHELSDFWIGHQ